MLFSAPGLIAVPSSYHDHLQRAADARGLATARAWRKLLFIPDRWYSSDKSFFDDPSFFVSPTGRTDPAPELKATLTALFREAVPAKKDDEDPEHIRCRFPARYHWLKEQLLVDESQLPMVECKNQDKFLKFADYDKISLIFSNYFLNNPASMFGHTFFRFHRVPGRNKRILHEGLLDDIFNFSAAVPPETTVPEYIWKGLTGGFRGRFFLVPYFQKIQEYNNYERRDLWEFELNLSQAQIDQVRRLLWELGPIYIDYFYLDDNCSYVLLSVLEAVDPSLELTGRFNLYAIPSDTLRAVTENKDLIRNVRYRASNLSKYLSRVKDLDSGDMGILEELIHKNERNVPATYLAVSANRQARITDAALDYIDFSERLWGSNEPIVYPRLRQALLQRRSQLREIPLPLRAPPEDTRPDVGHDGSRIGIHLGTAGTAGPFVGFNWRPALHDIRSNPRGYAKGLQIGFLDTSLQYDISPREFFLAELKLLEVLTLPQRVPLYGPLGWRLNLAYESYRQCSPDLDRCHHYTVQVGLGKSLDLSDRLFAFAILHADIGLGNEQGQGVHAGPSLLAGFSWDITNHLKLTSTGILARHFGSRSVDRLRHLSSLSFFTSKDSEFRLFFESQMAGQSRVSHAFGSSIYVYF